MVGVVVPEDSIMGRLRTPVISRYVKPEGKTLEHREEG